MYANTRAYLVRSFVFVHISIVSAHHKRPRARERPIKNPMTPPATELTVSAQGFPQFRRSYAVAGLSLELKRGEILGFLGPNGAGKTTTMQMLTGNLAPTAGAIRICGIDLFDEPTAAKARIGYLPETPPLYRELTVHEYIDLAARLHRVPKPRGARRSAGARCGRPCR